MDRPGGWKLNRVSAARAGAQILRHEGIDGVSMRTVAAAIGVTPMALYRCFDSADALRLASISEALERVPDPPRDGSVHERLDAWAHGARRRLRATDGLAAACLADWPALPAGCRMMEGLLAVAADHTGSTIRQCVIAHAVFVYALTRAQAERAVARRRSGRQLPAVAARPKKYPRLAALEHQFPAVDANREFAVGLDALLTGLLDRSPA